MTTKMTIKEYFASAGSKFSDQDARVIGPVLAELSEAGDVTSHAVVDAARSTNSPLHRFFEWNDATAATLYRNGQAAEMINHIRVRVIDHGRERSVRAYKIAKATEPVERREYLPREIELPDSDEILANAIRDLQEWRIKYRPYADLLDQYNGVVVTIMNQISEVVDDYMTTTPSAKPSDAVAELADWAARHRQTSSSCATFAEHFRFMFDAIKEAEEAFDPDTKTESVLARENRMLRERVEELERDRGLQDQPMLCRLYGLTGSEARILSALRNGHICKQSQLILNIQTTSDDPRLVDVFVCRMRQKLAPHNIEIKNQAREGYFLTNESKQSIKNALLAAEEDVVAA